MCCSNSSYSADWKGEPLLLLSGQFKCYVATFVSRYPLFLCHTDNLELELSMVTATKVIWMYKCVKYWPESAVQSHEHCLSAVFFALLTCWHEQFSKIFAFLFSPLIKFYLEAKLVVRENPKITKQWQSDVVFLCSGKHSFERTKSQTTSQ